MVTEFDTDPRSASGDVSSSALHAFADESSRPTGQTGLKRFLLAAGLSAYGDWLSTVGLVVLLFQLTKGPVGPATYMLVRVAPRVVGPWIGGRLSDAFGARRLLVTASGCQALLTVSLIASHRVGSVSAIYVAVAASQFLGALGKPSQGALLPALVDRGGLPRANAAYWLVLSTSIFVSPAIGALVLAVAGPDVLFACDAATFLLAALLLTSISATPRRSAAAGSAVRSQRELVRLALRQSNVRMVVAANFASGMVVTVTQALLVLVAQARFGSSAAVGYMYASVGLGSAVGGALALRWAPSRAWTRLAIFVAISIEVVAITGFTVATAEWLILILLAASAATGNSFDTWGLTEIQRQATADSMGRYSALIFSALYIGMLVGAVWALATSNLLRWDVSIECVCGGALVLVGGVWLWGGGASPMRGGAEHAPT